jgi:hypothetical protein
MRWLYRLLKWAAVLLVIAVAGLLGIRTWQVESGPPLALWHTYSPRELKAEHLRKLEWAGYLEAENALFADVRANVTDKLPPEDRVAANRYYEGSPIYPGRFAADWNRSYLLEPAGDPVGAVVLLHGCMD